MMFCTLLVIGVEGVALAQGDGAGGDSGGGAGDGAATGTAAGAPAAGAARGTGPAVAQAGPDSGSPATPPASEAPAVAAPAPAPAPAPSAAKPPAISGFIDTTYNYNLNRPSTGVNGMFSYSARHNNLALNAAHLAINGEATAGLTYTVEVDAGTDAVLDTSNYNPMGTDTYKLDVQEAYATYKHDKFGIRAGKFVTFNGIEVIESGANPTVSRGYLFGLAEPFTNTGAEVFYQATDEVDVHLGVVNGWDVVADNNRGKTILAKIGIVPSKDSLVTISAYAGPEQTGNAGNWRETIDVTALVKVGKIDLNLQGNFGREDKASPTMEDALWYGVGVQPLVHVSDRLTVGGRAEYFKDNDGARTGTKVQLVNLTVTPGYLVSPNFLLRGEARVDIADQAVFLDSTGGTMKNQIVALGEAIASF
jgi:hypothetical protein